MRPIETLLVLANLLTFVALTFSLPRAVRWMRYSAPIALLIAVAQVLVEGPRWQMVPAYALTGLFFLVWLLQNIAPVDRPAGQIRTHRVAVGLAVGTGCTRAGGLHRSADRAPGVSLAASKRAIRDWHVDLPLGGCQSSRRSSALIRMPVVS